MKRKQQSCNNPAVLLFDYNEIKPKNAPVFYRVSVNENTPLHKHNYVEFFYSTEGSITHVVNGEKEIAGCGDSCLLTPNDTHKFELIEKEKVKHTDICMDLKFFTKVCDCFSPSLTKKILAGNALHFHLSAEKLANFEQYVTNLSLNEIDDSYRISAQILTTMIIELAFSYLTKKNPTIPEWMVDLLGLLNSRVNIKTPLSDIIKKYHYNENYIRGKFKQYIGTNMTDYFNRQKMNYAYNLLSSTKLPVESICESIGFNNISYFYHLFKSIYNKTPNDVRNR